MGCVSRIRPVGIEDNAPLPETAQNELLDNFQNSTFLEFG